MIELLIDGDIVIYQAAAPKTMWKAGLNYFRSKKDLDTYVNKHPEKVLKVSKISIDPNPSTIKTQLVDMVGDIGIAAHRALQKEGFKEVTLTVKIYVKGNSKNYRSNIASSVEYKANRGDKPFYHEFARRYLIDEMNAVPVDDQETDDQLGIEQMLGNRLTCICTKDKDLLTIPGWNFNWITHKLTSITEQEADKYFYSQLLIGDRADNIKGLPGIGPKKAEVILKDKIEKKDLLQAVLSAFKEQGYTEALVEEIGRLMYIRRRPDEMWSIQGVFDGNI